ncbi:Flavin-dependent monooxygenase ArsO associated with arsenic resistance [Streptomyces globisporus]|uniref:Flavin-dependent monooxygenase ArsO associated with arsenic resistance n=1 Tax=Streptomyces globisporus TaxID=1908 RepID=A0ABN8VDY9_STRGL|nr:Flavin-dependent monooxygenase ArsO associated with arsenic resistance [Streptomyces globisporus]
MTWVTRRPARFLPDSIDGRALFDLSTARRRALGAGCTDTGGVASLGDIVAVPPVRAARDAGRLEAKPMFSRLTASGGRWDDGIHTVRGRDHLVHRLPPGPVPSRLNLRGRIPTDGSRVLSEPRLHLPGYGDWTGQASATLIGVGRPARDASHEIAQSR